MGKWPGNFTNIHYMFDVINHHRRQSGCAALSENNCSQGGSVNSIPPTLFLFLVSFVLNETGELGLEMKLLHERWLFFLIGHRVQ